MDRYDTYTALLLRHRTQVWRMCWLRASGNWDRCCDLLQEVSIALWLNFDKLRPDATPGEERAWVRWQARSVFDSQRRHKTLHTVPIDDTMADALAASDSSATDETIDEVLAVLGPDERRMVRLRLDGYCADEIADLLGMGRDAVYQRMHRAVVKMRRVVLALLAIFVTASIAVAVVPQWRNALFVGTAEQLPQIEEPAKAIEPAPVVPVDTVSAVVPEKPAPRERLEPMEYMELTEMVTVADEPLPSSLETPTVAVDGCRLTVSGVYGERVTVYSMNGKMLASQICNGICTFTVFPDNDFITVGRRYTYKVKIGNRPMIEVIQ